MIKDKKGKPVFKDKAESERVEFKSVFEGTKREWLKLIKTAQALANTKGGKIKLLNISSRWSAREFDPANIDNKINSYVGPRIVDITARILKSYTVITITNSFYKPHFFLKPGRYKNPKPKPQQITEFSRRQIYVRHSAKNELATKDDFDRMFQEKLDEFLRRINLIAQYPLDRRFRIEPRSPRAVPIRFVKKGKGFPVMIKRTDPNKDYPYLTTDLARQLHKSVAYTAKAATKLKLKQKRKYHIWIKVGKNSVTHRYSKGALKYLRDHIVKCPNYNPFKD